MNQKFTAEEVREKAHGYSLRGDDRTAAMLNAYADTLSKPADSGRVDANCMDVLRRLRDMLPTVGICGWPAGVSALDEAISALAAQGQGDVPHPDDIAVDAFATAMKAKLAEARAKGRGGWQDKNDCTQHRLSNMLRDHVEKGDPRDVANLCMFLHQRGEAILPNDSGRNVVCQLAFGERSRDPRDGPRVISWNEMPAGTYQLCLATAPPASPAGVPDEYREIARLIGRIFFYGDFRAETYNERELEKLLRKTGNFYETEKQLLAAAPSAPSEEVE